MLEVKPKIVYSSVQINVAYFKSTIPFFVSKTRCKSTENNEKERFLLKRTMQIEVDVNLNSAKILPQKFADTKLTEIDPTCSRLNKKGSNI